MRETSVSALLPQDAGNKTLVQVRVITTNATDEWVGVDDIVVSANAGATFIVNSTNDPGSGGCDATECTLREAITAANARAGADTIEFAIPGGGVKTISPGSQLPTITDPVTIDGYSQPGASENTQAVGSDANLLIELNGSGAGNATGLQITGDDSTVGGLVINRFSVGGILVSGGATGNFIGTNASGTQVLANSGDGVFLVDAPNNTVGGADAGARNVISANGGAGVTIAGGEANSNEAMGNYIGTDASGDLDLGNTGSGVRLFQAPNNTIGGTQPGEPNLIAFNSAEGVTVAGGGSTGNSILTNSIHSNGELGIDLGDDGVTQNDADDLDSGANNLQNFPIIDQALINPDGSTTVSGTLDSTPDDSFTIEVFRNSEAVSPDLRRQYHREAATTLSEAAKAKTSSTARTAQTRYGAREELTF